MPESPSSSSLTPDQPWPGSAPYTEADRAFFHGRRRETEELRRLLQRETLTLLSGVAGAGKTSLVRAGLLPVLNGEWLPVIVRMDWAAASDARPLSTQLLDALEAAARLRGLDAPRRESPAETLWELFHRSGARWWTARQRMITPLLVLDGFETAFTAGIANATTRRHRDGFFEELSQLASNRPPPRLARQLEDRTVRDDAFDFGPVPVRILVVIREEFAPRLVEMRRLFPTLRENQLRLTDFTRDQARDVLVRASAQRVLFADGVIDELIPRLASGDDPEHPVPPGRLSTVGQELAAERLRRNAAEITREFIAPPAPPAPAMAATPAPAPSAITSPAALPPEPVPSASRSRARAGTWLALAAVVIAALGAYAWRSQAKRTDRLTAASRSSSPGAAPVLAPTPERAAAPAEPKTTAAVAAITTPSPAKPEPGTPMPTTPGIFPAPAATSPPPTPTPIQPPEAAPRANASTPTPILAPSTPSGASPSPKPEDRDAAAARSILERERKRDGERQRSASEPRRRLEAKRPDPEQTRKPAAPAPTPAQSGALRRTPFVPVGG